MSDWNAGDRSGYRVVHQPVTVGAVPGEPVAGVYGWDLPNGDHVDCSWVAVDDDDPGETECVRYPAAEWQRWLDWFDSGDGEPPTLIGEPWVP